MKSDNILTICMGLYSYQQIALSIITKAETQSDDNHTSIRYYVTDGLYSKISEMWNRSELLQKTQVIQSVSVLTQTYIQALPYNL